MKILVTGSAGFIGAHVCNQLLLTFPEALVVETDIAECETLEPIFAKLGYEPTVNIQDGVAKFTAWYESYFAKQS